jgi:glutamyl-tRNA synthetase
MVRDRFAPSSTGYPQMGSARTFILDWFYVRKLQGVILFRIDDTDVDRNTEASPAAADLEQRPRGEVRWPYNREMNALSTEESNKRAAHSESFNIRYKIRREPAYKMSFHDPVYGPQTTSRVELTGQPVWPSAFAVFTCIGSKSVLAGLQKV